MSLPEAIQKPLCLMGARLCRTSKSVTCHPSCQTFDPVDVLLSLLDGDWVAFLEYFVDRDERLECLDLVGHHWLPVSSGVSPRRVALTGGSWLAYTFIPAQKDRDDLWSQV